MLKRIVGKKIGMTRVFTETGQSLPVTVVEVGPVHILKVLKKTEGNGHAVDAIEVGFDVVREVRPELKEQFGEEFSLAKALRLTKPVLGQITKAGFEKKFGLVKQLRVCDPSQFNVGEVLDLTKFDFKKRVTVTGISKGRGFTGPIKRHGVHMGPNSHGSRYHRRGGSMGPSASPSRVYPGKKLAGQYGNETVTVRNLEVIRVDAERNLLVVKGAIPGANGNYVMIKASS